MGKKIKLADFKNKYMTIKDKKNTSFYEFQNMMGFDYKYDIWIYYNDKGGKLSFSKKLMYMKYDESKEWFIETKFNDLDIVDSYLTPETFTDFDNLIVDLLPPYPDSVCYEELKGVYFIGSPSLHSIKIGIATKSVIKRLKQLQTSNPEKLKIYGVIENGIEKKEHEKFANLRQQGEWFAKTQELKDFILNIEYSKQSPLIHEILENRQELIS